MTGPSGLRAFISRSLTRDARGQSAPIGTVLLLIIVLLGTTAVAALGAVVIEDTRQQSELERAEQSMTLFDSRAALVALGSSNQQTIEFPNGDGQFEVREDLGWIRITHNDYDGAGAEETIYNRSLGAVVFTNGDAEIAYQGGGVWRRDGGGPARMISPPEFHYRDATLTLPVIRTLGSGSASGATSISIDQAESGHAIFPNTTARAQAADGTEIGAPYNGTESDYQNPLKNGTINVTVKGPYSEGWEEYFRTHTTGTVYADHDNNIVTLQLESTGDALQDFQMPERDGSVSVPAMASNHKINNFTIHLSSEKNDFNQLHWSFYTEDTADVEYELHVGSQKPLCGGGAGNLDVSIYYYNASSGVHHEWQNMSIDPATDPNFNVDCTAEVLTMNFTSTTSLTYGDIDTQGSDNKWHYGPEITSRNVNASATATGHIADCDTDDNGLCEAGEDDPTYTKDVSKESLDFLTNHYFSLMSPEFELTVHEGPGKGKGSQSTRVDTGNSGGTLDYEVTTDSRFITFLHITENEIAVRLR
ncbi:DUF7289 family protein [Haladaptatus sp. ZSTT2]|uniref:DUF7289 family protein n=1 Tax=Haladaptatus sp. ZSTT2 TaxID=3120515 RepID=UPI003FA5A8BD